MALELNTTLSQELYPVENDLLFPNNVQMEVKNPNAALEVCKNAKSPDKSSLKKVISLVEKSTDFCQK